MTWISAILVIGFGSLTLYLNDPRFIQLKPTIIYAGFALLLFGGLAAKKPLLRYVFGPIFEGLNETGIEYLFCNLGTDHAPLIEEMARWRKEGRKPPATIVCPHENTAMHMAAGYAMVTGRGQAVMVHVDAGTGNTVVAAHNICRGRIPFLFK